MSVRLEFINVIIPRKIIDKIYPGGSEALIVDDRIREDFYDDDLVRYGAMSPDDIEFIVNKWKKRGLKGSCEIQGKTCWYDMCVAGMLEGATLPCSWLKVEEWNASYIGE